MFVYRVDDLINDGMINNIKIDNVTRVNILYNNVCVYTSDNLDNFTLGRGVVIECHSHDGPTIAFDRVDYYEDVHNMYNNTDILYCGNPIIVASNVSVFRSVPRDYTLVMNINHMYRSNNTDVFFVNNADDHKLCNVYSDVISALYRTTNNVTDLTTISEKNNMLMLASYDDVVAKCDGIVWFTLCNIRKVEGQHGPYDIANVTVNQHKDVSQIEVAMSLYNHVVFPITECYILYKTMCDDLKVTHMYGENVVCTKIKKVGDYNYYILNLYCDVFLKMKIVLAQTEEKVDAYVVRPNVYASFGGRTGTRYTQ